MTASGNAGGRAGALGELRRAGGTAVVACGALAVNVRRIARRRGWEVDVFPLPALLHNRPERIPGAVAELAGELRERYDRVALAYADCGTYGALDDLCRERGWHRLAGLHCYDLYAGPSEVARLFEEEPGTYLLTDFLVRSFDRTVLAELGLDRYPELHDAYFGHYRRVVWLRQDPQAGLEEQARAAASRLRLPLTVVDTGQQGLLVALQQLLASAGVA